MNDKDGPDHNFEKSEKISDGFYFFSTRLYKFYSLLLSINEIKAIKIESWICNVYMGRRILLKFIK